MLVASWPDAPMRGTQVGKRVGWLAQVRDRGPACLPQVRRRPGYSTSKGRP